MMNTTNNILLDLNEGLSLSEICMKYSISFQELFKIVKTHHLKTAKNMPDYITTRGGKYCIRRGQKFYGMFDKLSEAINMKNKLINSNWCLAPQEYLGVQYIHKFNGKFRISKRIKCKTVHFGEYSDLNTAIFVRNELVSCDWNKNLLDDIIKKYTGE